MSGNIFASSFPPYSPSFLLVFLLLFIVVTTSVQTLGFKDMLPQHLKSYLLCSPLDPSNSCFYVRGPTEKERVVNFFAMPFFFSEHNKVRSCNWCSKTGFADQFKIQQLNLWRSASSSPPPWYLRLTCILIKGR